MKGLVAIIGIVVALSVASTASASTNSAVRSGGTGASAAATNVDSTEPAVVPGGFVFCFVSADFSECTINVVGNVDFGDLNLICPTVMVSTSGPIICSAIFYGLFTPQFVNIIPNATCAVFDPSGLIYSTTHATILIHPRVVGPDKTTILTAICPPNPT
jgi:hypothetical protein